MEIKNEKITSIISAITFSPIMSVPIFKLQKNIFSNNVEYFVIFFLFFFLAQNKFRLSKSNVFVSQFFEILRIRKYFSFQMESMDVLDWGSGLGTTGNFGAGTGNIHGGTSGTPGGESMMVDEDYMELMTDTLFSTISSNQPIYFPDPREIGNS